VDSEMDKQELFNEVGDDKFNPNNVYIEGDSDIIDE
jgi:hypothetical protein